MGRPFRNEEGALDVCAFGVLGAVLADLQCTLGAEEIDNLTFELGVEELIDFLAGEGEGLLGDVRDEEGTEDFQSNIAVDSHAEERHLDNLGAQDGVLGEPSVTLFARDVADVRGDGEGVEDAVDLLAGFLVVDNEGGDGTEGRDGLEVFFLGAVHGHGDLEFVFEADEGGQPEDGTGRLGDGHRVDFVLVGHFCFSLTEAFFSR